MPLTPSTNMAILSPVLMTRNIYEVSPPRKGLSNATSFLKMLFILERECVCEQGMEQREKERERHFSRFHAEHRAQDGA